MGTTKQCAAIEARCFVKLDQLYFQQTGGKYRKDSIKSTL